MSSTFDVEASMQLSRLRFRVRSRLRQPSRILSAFLARRLTISALAHALCVPSVALANQAAAEMIDECAGSVWEAEAICVTRQRPFAEAKHSVFSRTLKHVDIDPEQVG